MNPGPARRLRSLLVPICLFVGLQTAGLVGDRAVFAGHGMMTAFGNVAWLPEPGRTPDQAGYVLDAWYETGQLWLAATPSQVVERSLGFAREKLAEAEVMVNAENVDAARVAVEHYWRYVAHAERAALSAPPSRTESGADELIEVVAVALLEQQYILTILYPDLPTTSRSVIRDVLDEAQQRYEAVADRLPRTVRGPLVFKENEVRWSIEMALRADEEAG